MDFLRLVGRACGSWLAALAAVIAIAGEAAGSTPPKVEITAATNGIFINGDCNNPAVWVNGELRLYGSPYPSGGFMGGVATYKGGGSVEALGWDVSVTPDRSKLGAYTPAAFGPWFESVLADDNGALWAYYHAEFPTNNRIHPRIGTQVSYDAGATWTDLGIILDTPDGTDEPNSHLGYGFIGGNGDCSAILDANKEYVYFFFSQYGSAADTQGIATARMRWADRATPVGKVVKWHNGAWDQPGLGGQGTPILSNVGDAHALRAPFDYWWGPSIHWNTFLHRYVILLNRSNTSEFTYDCGVANWYTTSASLEDPSRWDDPAPLPFTDGFQGSWYPQIVGTSSGETDTLAGETARLFVHGLSVWNIRFLKSEDPTLEPQPEIGAVNPRPVLNITVGEGSSDATVEPGTTLTIVGRATDADGDMAEHWLEIQNPQGQWSWEGWLTGEPWAGALGGSASLSIKTGQFTFTEPGTYTIRTTAIDSAGYWLISAEVHVHVGSTDLPVTEIQAGGSANNIEVAQGTTLAILGRAKDRNGDLKEHWLEIRNPAGQWSWEGWLTEEPWAGALNGDGFSSVKSASFKFDQLGEYLVRSTAVDPHDQWVESTWLAVRVVQAK